MMKAAVPILLAVLCVVDAQPPQVQIRKPNGPTPTSRAADAVNAYRAAGGAKEKIYAEAKITMENAPSSRHTMMKQVMEAQNKAVEASRKAEELADKAATKVNDEKDSDAVKDAADATSDATDD